MNAFDDEGIANLNIISAVNLAAGPAIKYWRKSACDAQGKFTFTSVPTGAWYVLTSIAYEVYSPTVSNVRATETEGGLLVQKVVLRSGPNNVILTTEDLHTGFPF